VLSINVCNRLEGNGVKGIELGMNEGSIKGDALDLEGETEGGYDWHNPQEYGQFFRNCLDSKSVIPKKERTKQSKYS